MGVYNILNCDAVCPSCHSKERFEIQFQYGHLRLYEYEIGSTIFFKNLPNDGTHKLIKVKGIAGPCPNCLTDNLEFDICIDHNVIIDVENELTR
jgi:hypothetical protein